MEVSGNMESFGWIADSKGPYVIDTWAHLAEAPQNVPQLAPDAVHLVHSYLVVPNI